tara:strand:+ start:417 stop:890 length:474 start_codon:yes stop_codon:yes gene_type:complete
MTSLVNFDRSRGHAIIESIRAHKAEGVKIDTSEQDYLKAGFTLYLEGDSQEIQREAEAVLVEYWTLNIEGDDAVRTVAQIRAAFSKASEEFHDQTGGSNIVVKDGKLVLAQQRAKRLSPFAKVSKEVKKAKLTAAAEKRIAKATLIALQAEIKAAKK